MPSSQTQSLHQTLPWTVFQQVGDLIKQMVKSSNLIVTEATLSLSHMDESQVDRFVAVVSSRFSALLQGKTVQSQLALSHSTPADGVCHLKLTFDPREIAVFLTHLETLLPNKSPLFDQFRQAKQSLQPNDPECQSQFTLQLIERLAPDQTLYSSIEDSLWQQVEQERLLNEVTTLIRHSLELSVILETAVHQVRQFLHVDRLIIYQFNILAPSCRLDSTPDTPFLWETIVPDLDGITYESRENESIPSVLHFVEEYSLAHVPSLREMHPEGLMRAFVALDDCDHDYSVSAHFLHRSSHQVQAELVTPIIVRGELWGLLIAHHYTEPRLWQESEKAFLQRIVDHLAIAIYQSKLYAQLQQQTQTLEQQVIDRTQDLRDTLVTAQAAGRAKTEFLSTMSHELRSPLTTIIGMAATLLRHQLIQPDAKGALTLQKQQEYLQTIQNRGEHLLALINDILDLSQVETGRAVLEIREFSLFQLARQALNSLQKKADLKNVELRLNLNIGAESFRGSAKFKSFDQESPRDRFKADPQRVKQILTNLLSNAIKFTPENGCVTLRVWVNEETAILRVEDTGIGISKAEISLLFQKFQQLDASYHRKYEGTGLGLALTKQLVELHNGTIEVDSTVGVGSQFTVHLPAQAMSAGDRVREQKQSAAPHQRIVLIEAHEETATLICDLLTVANYDVIWMIEGSTALKQIEMVEPAVVLIDIQQSGMDGYQIIQTLQSDPATQSIKILALLTEGSQEEKARCLAAGVSDCWMKSIDQPERLIDQVAALVQTD